MNPGTPIVGQDTVLIISRDSTTGTFIDFFYDVYDIAGTNITIAIYLIINGTTRQLLRIVKQEEIMSAPDVTDASGTNTMKELRFMWPVDKTTFIDKYRNTYPVFKIRLEVIDNSTIYAESNEFKVVLQ